MIAGPVTIANTLLDTISLPVPLETPGVQPW